MDATWWDSAGQAERVPRDQTPLLPSQRGRMNEDSAPEGNPYTWSAFSKLTINEFVNKYKPSMVQNDGTKPWLYVMGKEDDCGDEAGATEEAQALLKETTEKIEKIKNDDSIPTRSNKKTGAKSKKEVRELAQAEATEKLKEIAIRHSYVCGKWLLFVAADRVDMIWSKIASSLTSGPLSSTSAFQAKVATSPREESPNYQHLICVYIPNVYDKAEVTKVMKVLLRSHGLNLSGVKSNLYTVIGIDSKHPSGIPSTIWRNSALMKDAEIKELKDAFFAEVNAAKPAPSAATTTQKPAAPQGTARGTSKPKPKKKTPDDPFASDDDAGGDGEDAKEEEKRKKELKAKTGTTTKTLVTHHAEEEEEDEEGEGEGEGEPPRQSGSTLKKKGTRSKGGQESEDEGFEVVKSKSKKRKVIKK